MEGRITPCSLGGYTARWGAAHKGGYQLEGRAGFTMPAFITYRQAHFDTMKQAEAWIKEQEETK